MSRWVLKGLSTGIVTTKYPFKEEASPGITPGKPESFTCDKDTAKSLISKCPMNALNYKSNILNVNFENCIHCYRCRNSIQWDSTFEWAKVKNDSSILNNRFQKSLHIRVVDAGDCGACLNEVKLLNNPFYNMHRLGFFITPTPRKADVLLVVGPVTEHMKTSLIKAYEAMPTPKRVIAVGTCAINGGIFKDSFLTASGVKDVIPVDLEIPGCPPPPLAILHGLLLLTGKNIPSKKGDKNE